MTSQKCLYMLPVLVVFTSLWICPLKAAAQIAQDSNHNLHAPKNISWESSAKLHNATGTDKGVLKINSNGFEFLFTKGRTLTLPFTEVQTFFLTSRKLIIETYQNRKHHLPGVQRLKFDLDQAVPPELAADLSERVGRPSQNAVPDPSSKGTVIPAHHRTIMGGTNGTLRFTDSGIDYVTDVRGDSRSWRWADLETLSDLDPYHLLVFGYRDTYSFDLKEPLTQALFNRAVDAIDTQSMTGHGQRPTVQSSNEAEKTHAGEGK
jgi:hypothetical protein